MNEPYAPPPGYPNQPGYPPPPRQGMGCFAKGCITLVVLVMLLGVLVVGAGFYLFRNFTAFVSTGPVSIRTYAATDEQYHEVITRYGAFIQALNEGKAATFTLSTDDLNTLIARDPEFKDLRGKVYMTVEKDEIVAETSFLIPQERRRFNGGSERVYFNGRVRFGASYSGGEMTVFVRKIESMDGKPMPDYLITLLNKADPGQGFTQSMHDARRNGEPWAEAMSRVEKIIVEDGKIIATAAAGAPATNPVPPPGQSPEPVASPANSE